jgi:hypothetical protein
MYEEVSYQKPFLKEVVVRSDFVAPIGALQEALPAKLAKDLSKIFPISESTEGIASQLVLQPAAGEVQHRQTRFKQWNFFDPPRRA